MPEKKTLTDADKLAQEKKIAIVVSPNLGQGQIANRCAVLSTGLAAHHEEIIGEHSLTSDGLELKGFTEVPIVVLSAKDEPSLRLLEEKARQLECSTFVFLARAQGLRSYSAYRKSISKSTSADLDVDAFLLYGPKKAVNKITGNLPVLR